MDALSVPDVVNRPASPHLAHIVSGISFYRENGLGLASFRHAAPLALPLLISLGTPFRIALGREPNSGDAQPSFVAGLFPGPVQIESDGRAACVQIDFTPLGAFRFHGGAVADLTAQMIDLGDVLGREGRRLAEMVADAPEWPQRFAIVEDFVHRRAVHEPSPAIAAALDALCRSGGTSRIGALATEVGWSRKHLARRFQQEIGVAPKTLAQMLRFHRACGLARSRTGTGWASIAIDAGYADQAHLARDFRIFSGETPTAWAARIQGTDSRLARAAAG
nr:helix-turn-helix domain-containing protein [Bradyrhizobium symbiodeficiens]